MPRDPIALATVISDDYLLGALTMIDSFRQSNPWFDGDVIAIYRSLSPETLETLENFDRRLLLRKISSELDERMAAVAATAEWKSGKELQFASIEAFAINGYDRVIFCDSDLLFLDSIEEPLAIDAPLVVCGDGAHFRGGRRRVSDFAELPKGGVGEQPSIAGTFNSGMMVLDRRRITSADHDALVGMVEPERWLHDRTGHTDQMLLNLHFNGRHRLVSPAFNYLLSHRALIQQAIGLSPEDARVLHFTGPQKPWLRFEDLGAAGMDHQLFAAYCKWRDALAEFQERSGLVLVPSS